MAAAVIVGVTAFGGVLWLTSEDPPDPAPADAAVVVDDYTQAVGDAEALYESLGMRWDF